jgi:hypothetical protein
MQEQRPFAPVQRTEHVNTVAVGLDLATGANALPLGQRRKRVTGRFPYARARRAAALPAPPPESREGAATNDLDVESLGQLLECTGLNGNKIVWPVQITDGNRGHVPPPPSQASSSSVAHDNDASDDIMGDVQMSTLYDPKTPRRHPPDSPSCSLHNCTARRHAHRRHRSDDLALDELRDKGRRLLLLAHDLDLRHRRKMVKRNARA